MSSMTTRIGASPSDAGSGTGPSADHAAAVEAVRTAIARGDVYQVNLVQHLSDVVLGQPARARRPARPPDTTERRAARRQRVAGLRGKRLGDRLGLARALPLEERGRAPDAAHQGDQAPRRPRRASRLGQGRRRARHDRRPRAQRPLARLRPRHGPLAGADGRRAAGRRRASRLDRRGRRAARRRSRGDPRRALPGRLSDGGAEDRGRRPHRGARAGGTWGVDGGARPRPRKRRPRACADDPHVRGRQAGGSTCGWAAGSSGTPIHTRRSPSRSSRRRRSWTRSAHHSSRLPQPPEPPGDERAYRSQRRCRDSASSIPRVP